jgi:hypothetical protein
MIQHHDDKEPPRRMAKQADRLIAEAKSDGSLGGAKVTCIAIHPYITGVPHRIGSFAAALAVGEEVVFWQGRKVLGWHLGSGDRG